MPQAVSSSSPQVNTMPERPKMAVSQPVVARKFTKVSTVVSRPSVSTASVNGLQVGQVIEHERFGIGEVLKMEGTGDNCKATVKFRHAGEKQLLLKFARFKVIG